MAPYDPVENASPETRERYLNALERRKSREASFQVEVPLSSMKELEARAQQAWVHWEYSPEEWAFFEQVDWKRQRLTCWVKAGVCAASVIAAILPWFLFSLRTNAGLIASLFLPGLVCCCPLLILWALSLPPYREARERHRARQKSAHTVTISRQGIWEAGTFFPLEKWPESSIKKVSAAGSPPVLQFRLRMERWRLNRPSGKVSTYMLMTLHVPVPRGHEDEAAHLVQRFRAEVIEAEEQARQQKRMGPPEPV